MTTARLWFAALGLLCLLSGPAPAHDPIKNKTPHDLDLLPRNTCLVMHLRAGDLWKRFGPAGAAARLEQTEDDLMEDFAKNLGFPLPALERFTLIMPGNERGEPMIVVTLNQALDRDKVLKTLLKPAAVAFQSVGGPGGQQPPPQPPQPEVKEKQVKGRTMHVLEEKYRSQAVCFLSDRMFVFGISATVQAALEIADEPDAGPFAVQCRKAAQQNPPLLMAFHVDNLPPIARRGMENTPVVAALLEAKTCFVTVAANNGLEATAVAHFADAARAEKARQTVTAGLKLLRTVLPMGLKEMGHVIVEDPDAPEHAYALLKGLDADLQQAQVEQAGTTVKAVFRHTCDDKFLANLLAEAFPGLLGARARGTFRAVGGMLGGGAPVDPRIRPEKAEALKKIAAAFEKYRATHGHYPPAAIYGKDGTPLLSWRVALLPYLGEAELYQQFKLDEPWYSKHNRPLLKKMPKAYGETFGSDWGHTNFRMILGPGAAYDGKEGVKPGDLTDGAGQTLLVVENVRFNSVGWTRPEGYRFGGDLPLPRLNYGVGGSEKGFYALFGDGKVRFVKDDVGEKTFRAMITKNGGEKVDEKDLGEVAK